MSVGIPRDPEQARCAGNDVTGALGTVGGIGVNGARAVATPSVSIEISPTLPMMRINLDIVPGLPLAAQIG